MKTVKGAVIPIVRKAHHFVVEIVVQDDVEKKEGGYIVPKKTAMKRWNN